MAGEEQLSQIVKDIYHDIVGSPVEQELMKVAQSVVSNPMVRTSELKKGIMDNLIKSGQEKKLRNAVYKYLSTHQKMPHPCAKPEDVKEPLVYIRKAQGNWDKRIVKSLNSMCTELGIPLARKRAEKESKDLILKWTELGSTDPDFQCKMARNLSQFRPVYAPKDFLEVLITLRNPNVSGGGTGSFSALWGMLQVPLRVRTIHELRLKYSEMSINQCQSGIDDVPEIPQELFDSERNKLGKKVLAAAQSPLAQEFAKKGCPVSQRAHLWRLILGLEVDQIDHLYYEQLKASVIQYDLLVDSLIYKDVKLTAVNDDQYFVFEDYLYQVLLPFSRDTQILEHFKYTSANPPKSYIRGKLGVEDFAVTYPPNGVIPFHGFAMYVAPLCYIYDDPVVLYYVFREMYTRYFFRLHNISSHPQGIVSLGLLFESLLQMQEPQLFFHLKAVNAQPLRIAFKWLIRAFSGYLESEQVLLLWDRILAYNSVEMLAVLAVAIFSFRKTNLMQVTTMSAAEAVLADLTTLKVIPLIQLSLFSQ